MAVRLDILTNVKGQSQVDALKNGLNKMSLNATIAAKRLKNLEFAAARSKATFASLATTLKVGVAASLAAVTFGIGKFIKDTFAAGRLTESLQVRFKLLFNSAEEGGKAFDVLNEFASRVPFSLEAIAAGSGNLAVISKDADDLAKILEVTGNVAAATGLDFAITATQIQRAFAGGIASADIFRERGVRAMLGFEAGAKVSIEDTKKRFFEVFANGGQFSKATKDFENTLEAQVSFVEDGYFRFRQAASQPLFAGLKQQLIDLVGNFKENDKQLKALAKSIGEGLAKAFKNIEKAIKFLAKNMDNLITAFKIFIGLKIGTFITGLVAQFALFTTAVRGATISFHALNVAIRANPIGILLTVIQAAVVGIILFHKELVELGNKAINFVIRQIDKLKLKFFQLVHFFNKIPGVNIDVSSNIDELEEKIFQSLHKFDEEVPEIRVAVHADYSELDDLEADVGAAAQTTTEKTSEMFEGLKKGIQEAMTSANDTLGNFQEFGKTVFEDTTDEIAKMVHTGKADFKSLADAFIGELIRMQVKAAASKFLNFIGGSIGKSKGGGNTSGLGSLLGFFKMNEGGVVPGGAPYTDRVPALLTPGEVVIPRDKVGMQGSVVNNNTINISGNVDQRSIDQIRAVISSSPSHVGGANKTYGRNTSGLRNRGR
tara:strand:- start:1176 stop:3155 length:1980 start_codon:yes stop_codon:yes gene_type:complete